MNTVKDTLQPSVKWWLSGSPSPATGALGSFAVGIGIAYAPST